MGGSTIVWFRQDLRLDDNPALQAALARGGPVVPVFVWSPDEEAPWAPGAASRWWLHHSLAALHNQLKRLGSRLTLRAGDTALSLAELIEETGADAVFWNRRYEPAMVERDAGLQQTLRDRGLTVQSFNASLLFEPWELATREGKPFQVFTPFWKACLTRPDASPPGGAPRVIPLPARKPASLDLHELKLLPSIPWDTTIRRTWSPGSETANDLLEQFLEKAVAQYSSERNRPDRPGTSLLSPHLHFGEVSPRRVWQQARRLGAAGDSFLREIGWREFAYHLLFHFPRTPSQPLREEFLSFPWKDEPARLRAWQRGLTGYPIVDAGMRQLWATGWMHNRVRMIVASFLVKDLLIPWQQGARWFWDTLVDADLANNTLGWQWTAGCGADAAPFFRVFNPTLQGEKFDPEGAYVRKWAPELAKLATKWIHRPWDAPPDVLGEAGVILGQTYPLRLVDHAEARTRALAAFAKTRKI